MLSRKAAFPTRLQRWEAAESNARKRVEERRRQGEEVDESEIEQAACEEYRRDPHGEDKDKSTTANDYEAYSSDGEEIVEGLQLPVIYDTVLPDGHDAITENPMFNKVKAKIEEGECTMVVPATRNSSVAKLSAKEQLVLEVEREIERAKVAWQEEMRSLERDCMEEIDSLRSEIDRLHALNAQIPVLEEKLASSTKLLEANRKAAIEGIRRKYEEPRVKHAVRKFSKAWREYIDEMHWMEVSDDGSKTPSKKQRHEEMRRQKSQSPFGVALFR